MSDLAAPDARSCHWHEILPRSVAGPVLYAFDKSVDVHLGFRRFAGSDFEARRPLKSWSKNTVKLAADSPTINRTWLFVELSD